MPDAIVITPALHDDVPEIQRLAREIWHAHYPGIISREQIDYMLEHGYATGVLDEFIDGPDSGIALALDDGRRVGFAAWFATDAGDEVKVEKLYVLQSYQRKGVGGRLIATVESAARQRGVRTLVLNVNKQNAQAIRAYEKHGFSVRAEVVVDIGHGFVMDDYIMAKRLGD